MSALTDCHCPHCAQVHQTVYEHIEKGKLYDKLRSTQYFGGLVWYLVERQKMKGILIDMIERNL